ncbi:MAG: flagellin [Acidimicrobiales bacterium]|jgi:flagellin
MRINNNIMAFNANRNLGNSNNALGKSLEKLSSGYRINRAGDDAAGLVISQKLRAEIGGLKTASRNAQDGISFVQTAEGGLAEVHNMLGRMRDLAVQGANDTNDAAARTAIFEEMTALNSEITRIGADTTFAGSAVFGVAVNLQVGSEGTGTAGQITIAATVAPAAVVIGASIADAGEARAIIELTDTAIATISAARGALGATQNRLESTINNLQVTTENLSASESRIRDTDMAAEMVNFTKNQILQQAGTAMLGQANSVPQSVLSLLQ